MTVEIAAAVTRMMEVAAVGVAEMIHQTSLKKKIVLRK
jgi:hypothetical protein